MQQLQEIGTGAEDMRNPLTPPAHNLIAAKNKKAYLYWDSPAYNVKIRIAGDFL